MLEKRSDRYTDELKDPMLSALLRETLADDPALAESPGRTDRIMRKVLEAGVRPARRFSWAPLGWAAGSFATAAAAIVLVFTFARLPMPTGGGDIPKGPIVNIEPTNPHPETNKPSKVAVNPPSVPDTEEYGYQEWVHTTNTHTPVTNQDPEKHDHDKTTVTASSGESTTKVAAALYDAGTAANDVGDYETAYHAYQASYEVTPTLDALMASGTALHMLAEEALDPGNLST